MFTRAQLPSHYETPILPTLEHADRATEFLESMARAAESRACYVDDCVTEVEDLITEFEVLPSLAESNVENRRLATAWTGERDAWLRLADSLRTL